MNVTTIKRSTRLTGELRTLAKAYIRRQFLDYKSKTGIFTQTGVKFVHKIGESLNISASVVKNLCVEAGVNYTYNIYTNPNILKWVNAAIDNGTCQATLVEKFATMGIMNTRGNPITWQCIDKYIRKYLKLDNGHGTCESPGLVNHQARKRPSVLTRGIGIPDSNKPLEPTTHLYNIHIGTLYKGLNISETQVKALFTAEEIETLSPNYLIAKVRNRRAKKTKRSTRR